MSLWRRPAPDLMDLSLPRWGFNALLIMVAATAFRQPAWILQYMPGACFFGLLFLGTLLTPMGNRVWGDREKKYHFIHYLLLMGAAQGLFVILGLTTAFAFIGQYNTFLSDKALLTHLKVEYLTSRILFPWGLFGIWALIIAYSAYVKKEYPLLATSLRSILPHSYPMQGLTKVFIENFIFSGTLWALLITLSASIVLIAMWIQAYFGLPSHAVLSIFSFVIFSVISPVIKYLLTKKRVIRLSKVCDLSVMLLIFVLIIVAGFLLSAYWGAYVLKNLPRYSQHFTQTQENCQGYFAKIAPLLRIRGFFWGWCLLWAPIAGSFIARISEGRRVREIVLGVFFWPVISLFFPFTFYYMMYFTPHDAKLGLGLISLVTILSVLRGAKNDLFLYAGFMPLACVHSSRIDLRLAPKMRGPFKTLTAFWMTLMMIQGLYLLGGGLIVGAQVLFAGSLILSLFYLGSLLWLRHLFLRFIPRFKRVFTFASGV